MFFEISGMNCVSIKKLFSYSLEWYLVGDIPNIYEWT